MAMYVECCSTSALIMAGTAILTLLYYLVIKRPKNYPPGPFGLPFVGYLPFLGKNAAETFRKMKSKYGTVMSVQMGRENWIVLNDYDMIYEAFVRQSNKFSGRPRNFMFHVWSYGYGMANLDGNEYKVLKKFGHTTMRGLGVGKIGIEENIIEEASFLIENLTTKSNTPLRIKLALAASNIVCRLTFGARLPYNDRRINTMLDIVREIFSDTYLAKMFGILTVAPKLRYIPPFDKALQDIIHKRETFQDVLRNIVEDHQESYDENNIRDVIDAFIKEMKSGVANESVFCINELYRHIRDLFEAGTATSSTALLWSFLCFANYPEYQEKIFEEIERVVGNNNMVQMKNRDEMPYTCAFIQELMRHRTLTPLGVFHRTTENATLNGYTIPKDTTISANIWAVHYDPDLFENPSEFRPERFLDEDGKFVESKHIIPFSIGPRHCYGRQIAKVELFIYLTNIVQKLKVVPSQYSRVPSFHKGTYNMVTYEPPAFEVEFMKR